jgi:hypothetical protein
MKKLLFVGAAIALILAACQTPTTVTQNIARDQAIVNTQQDIYQKAQPVPLYDFSEQRNTLIQIYNAKNEARQTWALFMSAGTGTPVYPYVCPSIGLPIPADTQLTNPMALVRIWIPGSNGQSGYYLDGTLPQPEPDGLHSSTNTDATYVICIRNGGKPELVYSEEKVTAVSHEVTYDPATKSFVDSGKDPTIVIDMKGGKSSVAPTPSPTP